MTKGEQIATTGGVSRSILDGVSTPAVSAPLAAIPNALTVLRLVLIPIFVALLLPADDGHSIAAGVVFGIAGISDYLDGWLARRWNVQSDFGRVADPLADRLMIDAAVVLMWLDGRLPLAALALILARDGALLLGYPLVRNRGYDFEVNFLGKLATWVLYAALVGVVASDEGTTWPLVLFWTGVALAVAAAAQYLAKALREVRR